MIRLATKHDRDAILQLARHMRHDAENWLPLHLRGQSRWEDCVAYIENLRADPNATLAVSETDDGISAVGCLSIQSDVATISDVVVHPDRRNKGLGSELVHWLESQALESGVTTVDVEVAAGNRADKFYTKLGYEPVVTRMRKIHNQKVHTTSG